jgi:hypothetical protein
VDGHSGLFDDLIGGYWRLIALDVDPLQHVPLHLREWFARIGGTATTLSADGHVRDIDGTYRRWFEAHGCRVVLTRPDFYIFDTGGAEHVAAMLDALCADLHTFADPSEPPLTHELMEEEARS